MSSSPSQSPSISPHLALLDAIKAGADFWAIRDQLSQEEQARYFAPILALHGLHERPSGSTPSTPGSASTMSSYMRTPDVSPRGPLPPLPPESSYRAQSGSPEVDQRVDRLEKRVAEQEVELQHVKHRDPEKKRRKRPRKIEQNEGDGDGDLESAAQDDQREEVEIQDEIDNKAKLHLQAAVREKMYRLIGYKKGETMPSVGGPLLAPSPPSADGRPTERFVPDFHKGANDPVNRRIQGHAAERVVEDERDNPGAIPADRRARWVKEAVVRELAARSWPHLQKIYKKQQQAAGDGGTALLLDSIRARRAQRRETRRGHLDDALDPFIEHHGLDPAAKGQLLHHDWTGEEWSGDDEAGNMTPAWRTRLYDAGEITMKDRDDPLLKVWEERRPAWMHIKFWEWQKKLLADRARKIAEEGTSHGRHGPTKRVDLGRVSELMPMRQPYLFMLDPSWKKDELPKVKRWHDGVDYPPLVPKQVCDDIVGGSSAPTLE
ncbi:hypothetical protein CALCODRAFT_544019 [Calocera cornea HHB12733]|uniref:Uncharacterized protein n=1 Tax=Calocera cornea HHB12733 TaxID=1353952 RepID=A0A165F7P3_9BASI|nr:hypothetical protein CALCODRAFT_544019 [Calocera cornea HHB12733]